MTPTQLETSRAIVEPEPAGGLVTWPAPETVLGTAKLFQKWASGFERHVNQLPRFDDRAALVAGGDPNIVYYHSY